MKCDLMVLDQFYHVKRQTIGGQWFAASQHQNHELTQQYYAGLRPPKPTALIIAITSH